MAQDNIFLDKKKDLNVNFWMWICCSVYFHCEGTEMLQVTPLRRTLASSP